MLLAEAFTNHFGKTIHTIKKYKHKNIKPPHDHAIFETLLNNFLQTLQQSQTKPNQKKKQQQQREKTKKKDKRREKTLH